MFVGATTQQASAEPVKGTPATSDNLSLSFHVKRARDIIGQAYDTDRWRDPTPAKPAEKRAWQRHRQAIEIPKVRWGISFYRDRMAQRFARHRSAQLELDSLTPYGEWAIPEYIVACESGGSWSAANPSGAAGPYQIMPEWGRPWPVTSEADKVAHHRIAARIWNGGAGASNWVCS